MKVLVTGASGFIAGYLVEHLLEEGWSVVGLDNHSKYGPVRRPYAEHPQYREVKGDAKDSQLVYELLDGCDHFVAGAAIIGGITLFHKRAYDLIAENERITAAAFDAAIARHREGRLKKITCVSSSMVFESATEFPSKEGDQKTCPPPASTYGFQKLATEYFAKGAWEQYQLPYTIVRPFNCVGIGERRARGDEELWSGNVKLAMSHVVPDLVQKVLRGQDPLHILGSGEQVRHFTHGRDLARGIRLAMASPAAQNEDFNLSSDEATSVREAAELVWRKIRNDAPFRLVSDPPFPHDVQLRVPSTEKAKRMLHFRAEISLSEALDEVIPWVAAQIEAGGI